MDLDAVVIGAGHNGLAAAVHLASKGWKVAVVEQAATPGGAIKTGELTLPGFRHDLYAMNLNLFAGSPFFAAHKTLLLDNGLAFVPAAHCFSTAFPDGRWLGIGSDLEETVAGLAKFSQRDADAWRAMSAVFLEEAQYIFALLAAPMPSFQTLRIAWRAYRRLGLSRAMGVAQMLVSSPRAFLDRHFTSDVVKATIAPWSMHLDFPPDAAGGGLFPYLEAQASQHFGMVLGKGGADTIVTALTRSLQALGGELMVGTAVVGIDVRQGKAESVRLADGRVLTAKRAVIANLHPQVLFGGLLPAEHADTPDAKRIAAFRSGPGTMMIHFALSDLPNWTASDQLRSYAYVHLAPSLEMLGRGYAEAVDGLLPGEPMLVVGQPTAIDPSRAPPGKHILWVQVRPLPATIKGDASGVIGGTNWDDVKEAYADRAVDIIERYAPGFRDLVLARATLSPLDLERDNPNLIGGDSLGGSHQLDQNMMFRPAAGWSRYKMPVRSLYMVGASTWPGAGVGAGSGYMLGQALAGK